MSFPLAHHGAPRKWIAAATTFMLLLVSGSIAFAEATDPVGLDFVCPLVEHERKRVLENYELERKLVESEYESRRRVFEMVEKLWAVRSIEKEIYLNYKRLRDRTRVRADRMGVLINQQQSIVGQYALSCRQTDGESESLDIIEQIETLQEQYRRIDCELLDKDLEIAGIDHAYDLEILNATRKLVENNIKTKFELVNDEFDLEQSKARVEAYRLRARACKKNLAD
jgi:hypothetical protein